MGRWRISAISAKILLPAVVGLLAGAFYDPAWAGGIAGPMDFVLVLGAGVLLIRLKLPPWLMILLAADAGYGLGLF